MRYLLLSLLLAAAIVTASAHAAPAAYVGDEGSNYLSCDLQHYGQAVITNDHLVYGQGWYICREAGGFSWYSSLHSARFYVPFYAPNAQGIAYACDLSPSCYVYAWVPAA